MSEVRLPAALAAQPRLDAWIGFEDQGHVRVATGKVEIGQGILTALAQIAADEAHEKALLVGRRPRKQRGHPVPL